MEDKTSASSGENSNTNRTNIWAVGEIHGGTAYFSESNLVGFYKELDDTIIKERDGNLRPTETTPNHIIFNGALLPIVPSYSTRGGRPHKLALDNLVSDISNASVILKPHLSRIGNLMAKAGRENNITYVMGPNEKYNFENKFQELIKSFNYNPDQLISSYYVLEEKVKAQKNVIEKTQKNVYGLYQELANLEQEANAKIQAYDALKDDATIDPEAKKEAQHKANAADDKFKTKKSKLATVELKLRADKSEVNDYETLANLYKKLIGQWFNENKNLSIEQIKSKFGNYRFDDMIFDNLNVNQLKRALTILTEEYVQLNEQIEKERVKKTPDSQKIDVLTEQSKHIADAMKKKSFDAITEVDKTIEKEQLSAGKSKIIYAFTGMYYASNSTIKIANELAGLEIQAAIKDSFGRRINLNIVSNVYATINTGIKSNKQSSCGTVEFATETSSVLEVNSKKILVTGNPPTNERTYPVDNTKVLHHLKNAQKERIDLVIASHSLKGSEELVPWRDQSKEYVLLLTLPPFIDREKAKELQQMDMGLKTPFLDAVSKRPVSSGFYKITYDGASFSTEFHSEEYMKFLSAKVHEEEMKKLAHNLKVLKPLNISSEEIDNKEQAQITAKLPSEMNNKLTNELLMANGIDPNNSAAIAELLSGINRDRSSAITDPNVAKMVEAILAKTSLSGQEKLQEMTFVILTDLHIGSPFMGMPATKILDGVTKYLSENLKKEYILAVLGDVLEGDLRSHKNELTLENDPNNLEKFEKWLVNEKGFMRESEEFEWALTQYEAIMCQRYPIASLDSQAEKCADKISPIAQDAKAIYEVSGNHYNKTFPNHNSDEAKRLMGILSSRFPEKFTQQAHGGDWGFWKGQIGGKQFILTHEPYRESTTVHEKLGFEGTVLSGHTHQHKITVEDNGQQVISLHLQGQSPYAESIGIGVSPSLRGFSILTLKFDEHGANPIVRESKVVTLKELIERGYVKTIAEKAPLVAEFEALKLGVRDATYDLVKVKG